MGFVEAVKTCFQKYVTFEGRAARPEYWWFILFCIVGGIVTSIFGQTLNAIFQLATLVPCVAVGARRLHDIGKSGWFQLLWFVPIIGWGILIWWACQPGTGPNAYGTSADANIDQQALPPGAV